MADIKWSAFPNGGTMVSGDQIVGLRSGANTRLTPVIAPQIQQSAFNFAAATGINDAFVVTLSPVPSALTDGLLVTMYSGTLQNVTTSPTLKVNALAAKPIVTFTGTIAPEDIESGSVYLFVYNAANDNFQLINPFITTADTFFVQQNAYNYAIDAGTANAYVVTLAPAPTAIDGGMPIIMRASHANTGASTIAVNGTSKSIANNAGGALAGGEIIANQVYYFLYDDSSDKFILINPSSYSTGSGFNYNSVSGTSQAAVAGNAYILNNVGATTVTPPTSASSTIGDTIKIKGRSSAPWIIQANTGQTITYGSVSSTVAGTATSALGSDSIQFVYVADNVWSVDWALSSGIILA